MCVCVRERERERKTHTEREREREREMGGVLRDLHVRVNMTVHDYETCKLHVFNVL